MLTNCVYSNISHMWSHEMDQIRPPSHQESMNPLPFDLVFTLCLQCRYWSVSAYCFRYWKCPCSLLQIFNVFFPCVIFRMNGWIRFIANSFHLTNFWHTWICFLWSEKNTLYISKIYKEEIAPFHVKHFEYPEQRYINVTNYYYYKTIACLFKNTILF